MKPGAPLVAPRLAPELDSILAARAEAAGVRFLRVEQTAHAPSGPGAGDVIRWNHGPHGVSAAGPMWHVQTALQSPGAHMAGNAVLALAAVHELAPAPPETLRHAAGVLARTPLPGRMETVCERPWVIVDGAHTGASAAALAATVADLRAPRLHLLLSCSAGKDLDAVLVPLLAAASAVTVTRADPTYSLPAGTLADRVRTHRDALTVEVIEDLHEAFAHSCAAGADTRTGHRLRLPRRGGSRGLHARRTGPLTPATEDRHAPWRKKMPRGNAGQGDCRDRGADTSYQQSSVCRRSQSVS